MGLRFSLCRPGSWRCHLMMHWSWLAQAKKFWAWLSASSFISIVVLAWRQLHVNLFLIHVKVVLMGQRMSVFSCCSHKTVCRFELELGNHWNPSCQGYSISFIPGERGKHQQRWWTDGICCVGYHGDTVYSITGWGRQVMRVGQRLRHEWERTNMPIRRGMGRPG